MADLIAQLQQCNPNSTLRVTGADIGGYDVCDNAFGFVIEDTIKLEVSIDHLEYEAYHDGWYYDKDMYVLYNPVAVKT